MCDLPGGLPNICGLESEVSSAVIREDGACRQSRSDISFDKAKSAFCIALHMHQPLIPAGGQDLATARLISNLEHMMQLGDSDRYNASIFRECYKRMGTYIHQLVDGGSSPRVMLEYSGTLLFGFQQMGLDDVLESLRSITCEQPYSGCVEWLGCPWGHAVAPSTPTQDFRLHVKAWQNHFLSLFGAQALSRVRGFSPSEMALPNHPDVAYQFVKTLRECGYEWVLVQEHTVENPESGQGPSHKHIPHLLHCRSSEGEVETIVALIKTQGSDTKLVAQMQPYFEAKGLARMDFDGREFIPLVTQIADGENGGVMMNEFPSKYIEVMKECSRSETPIVNASEYLEHLFASGISKTDLPPLQPIKQKAIWDRFEPGGGQNRLASVIEDIRKEAPDFHMDGGSWTNDISWVEGYDDLLGPMEKVSSLFHEKVTKTALSSTDPRYRQALYLLLCSQTSCYRYWGQGIWTDYGREICRRLEKLLLD